MKLEKPSLLLALFAWSFFFVEAVLLLMRRIPSDWATWILLVLFFVIAVMASAVANDGSENKSGVYRINYIDADTIQLVQLDEKTLKPLATKKGNKPESRTKPQLPGTRGGSL
jgi:hypothetical protein